MLPTTTIYGLFQKRFSPKQRRWLYRTAFNAYPPFVGAGIRIKHVSEDIRSFTVEMKLRSWNRNFVGTHFGGSLYAMCDPFFMILMIEALGRDYIVWDKAASIRFKKPGKGTVRAEFHLPESAIAEVLKELETKEKFEVTYRVDVKSAEGETVAEVEKLIYIRKKAKES